MERAGSDDALFERQDTETREDAETLAMTCTPYTGGPWNPDHQHGGAVSALVAYAVDRMPSPVPMRVARLSLDMFRGVPLTPLRVETRVTRGGRRIQGLETTIYDGDTPVTRATALRVRTEDDLAELDAPLASAPDLGSPPEVVPEFAMRSGFMRIPPFVMACDLVPGHAKVCGEPAFTWARLRCRVVAGEETSPLVRLAAVVDFASGTGNAMDYTKYTSINPDLSIHLVRAPRSAWVGLRGITTRSPDGIGQSSATIHDALGEIGRANATLLLDRR
ncbi:MAG: thioesterase family protein [bacterium]|nr:thioesterase family protein [bacterium]